MHARTQCHAHALCDVVLPFFLNDGCTATKFDAVAMFFTRCAEGSPIHCFLQNWSCLTKSCCKVLLSSFLFTVTALVTEPNASSFPPNAALATFLAPDVVVDACLCVYVRVKVYVGVCTSSVHVSMCENIITVSSARKRERESPRECLRGVCRRQVPGAWASILCWVQS